MAPLKNEASRTASDLIYHKGRVPQEASIYVAIPGISQNANQNPQQKQKQIAAYPSKPHIKRYRKVWTMIIRGM